MAGNTEYYQIIAVSSDTKECSRDPLQEVMGHVFM